MQKIFLGILALFVLEILVLIEVGSAIGAVNTILIMFLMMFVGIVLIKLKFKQAMMLFSQGQMDFSMVLLPIAGFLFLFPGFISDVIALLLLIPQVRVKASNFYQNKTHHSNFSFYGNQKAENGSASSFKSGRTIDGEATVAEAEVETKIEEKDQAK